MSNLSMLGLYDNPDSAADALDALHDAGFDSNNFDVLTGTPYPEGAFGEHVPQHRLFRFPLFGAIVGLTLSVFLTTSTQIIYPLVTGGKPILSIFARLDPSMQLTSIINARYLFDEKDVRSVKSEDLLNIYYQS